jgi:heptosyltransferase-2/glycosyl transferase protein BlmE
VTSPAPPRQPRRVCVFARLWEPGLGDFIQRNILLHLLRRAFGDAEITLVVGPAAAARFAEFFAGHSPASAVVVCPEYGDEDPRRWASFLRQIEAHHYECCVVDPDSRGLGAERAAQCGIGVRIGFVTGSADDQYLTCPVRLARPIFGLPDLLDFARALARALGLPPVGPQDAVPPFRYQPEPVPPMPGPVVAVHPGGARHWNRRWPLARYGELCQTLSRSENASFVLVGSEDERADLLMLAGHVAAGACPARVEISAGASLNRLASLLSAADVLVGNDSAPAHIAAALQTPTVVLYGPGMTEFMWTRVYLRHDGINRHYDCQTVRNLPRGPGITTMPCRNSCHYPYVAAGGPYPRCLTDIGVGDVHRAVRRQLSGYRQLAAAAGAG